MNRRQAVQDVETTSSILMLSPCHSDYSLQLTVARRLFSVALLPDDCTAREAGAPAGAGAGAPAPATQPAGTVQRTRARLTGHLRRRGASPRWRTTNRCAFEQKESIIIVQFPLRQTKCSRVLLRPFRRTSLTIRGFRHPSLNGSLNRNSSSGFRLLLSRPRHLPTLGLRRCEMRRFRCRMC